MRNFATKFLTNLRCRGTRILGCSGRIIPKPRPALDYVGLPDMCSRLPLSAYRQAHPLKKLTLSDPQPQERRKGEGTADFEVP
jgi:hypothetical protein